MIQMVSTRCTFILWGEAELVTSTVLPDSIDVEKLVEVG